MALKSPIRTASGHRIAYGQFTTVTASDSVKTGFKKIVACGASLASDPVAGCTSATVDVPATGGTLTLKTWQPTATASTIPTAATTFSKKVNWWAIGY